MSGPASGLVSSELARDALLELVNIGSGNAMMSLHRLVGGGSIGLSVPDYVPRGDVVSLNGMAGQGVVIDLLISGVVKGTFLAAFDQASALALAGALMGHDVERLGGLEESALVEAINIISCSFLGALSVLLGGVLVPSPPHAGYGSLDELVQAHLDYTAAEVCLSSRFTAADDTFSGRIIFITDDKAALSMLEAIGVGV